MELNKIAGAVLLSLLVAMVAGKIGNIVVPPHYVAHATGGEAGGTTTTEPPKPDPSFAVAINEATDAQGKSLHNRCVSCHTFEKGGPNRVGPNLWGVIGRKKGSHEGFDYSSAMKSAGGVWTMEELYKYLKNPQDIVPGTKMAFRLIKPEQRGAVIRYLRLQSDNPEPLPKVEPAADKKPTEGDKAGDGKQGGDAPAPKKDGVKKDEPAKDAPKSDETKKDEPPKDNTKDN